MLDDNTTTVLLALIAMIGTGATAVIAAAAAYWARDAKNTAVEARQQTVETHKIVNSRMDEMLAITEKSAAAEGRLEGAEIARDDPKARKS